MNKSVIEAQPFRQIKKILKAINLDHKTVNRWNAFLIIIPAGTNFKGQSMTQETISQFNSIAYLSPYCECVYVVYIRFH